MITLWVTLEGQVNNIADIQREEKQGCSQSLGSRKNEDVTEKGKRDGRDGKS